jgi:hypothetical protein
LFAIVSFSQFCFEAVKHRPIRITVSVNKSGYGSYGIFDFSIADSRFRIIPHRCFSRSFINDNAPASISRVDPMLLLGKTLGLADLAFSLNIMIPVLLPAPIIEEGQAAISALA